MRRNNIAEPESQSRDDSDWAEKIRSGDYAAFGALFEAYYEEIVHFARSYTKRQSVAEELAQDVFFNIWKCRESWRPRGALRVYLYGAARNECLMHLRRLKVERRWVESARAEPEVWPEDPDGAFRFEELRRGVDQAIDALPERRRLVFILSRHHGLSYLEIATLLGISKNTVEVQMVRALKTLREKLMPLLTVITIVGLTIGL